MNVLGERREFIPLLFAGLRYSVTPELPREQSMAKALDFTNLKIQALPAPESGRAEYKDTKEQGLYLRVTAAGVKTFSFVGRAKGSHRVERLTLGKYPQVKPDEARGRAREMAGRLASGISVAAASREKKGEMTVAELWDRYYAFIEKTTKTPLATKEVWDTYVASTWSKRRLSEVSALDVERWHLELPTLILKRREENTAELRARDEARRREIAARQAIRRRGPDPKPKPETPRRVAKRVTGKVSANKALGVLRAMYSFALDPKRAYFTGMNPASKHKMFEVQDRERFLQPAEMAPFFEAVAAEPNETMRDAILVALLTGQRRGNVLPMRWSEIDFDRAEWKLSGELTKNKKPHVAPLTTEAFEILKRRWESRTSAVFVFPAMSKRNKTGHIGEPKTAWRRIMDRSGITELIFHDLRRTLGSWQARGGASLVMIGKSLNHKTPEATAIYARLDMDPVRESMGSAASAMFVAGGVKQTAQVVALSSPRPSGQVEAGQTDAKKAAKQG